MDGKLVSLRTCGSCFAARRVHLREAIQRKRRSSPLQLKSSTDAIWSKHATLSVKGSPLSLAWRRKLKDCVHLLQSDPKELARALTVMPSDTKTEADKLGANCIKAEKVLKHVFRDWRVLPAILVHSSSKLVGTLTSRSARNKLAWLGDTLLFLFVTIDLIQRYPNDSPCKVNIARRRLIDRGTLSRGCQALGLDDLMIIGAASQKYQFGPSNLGEVFEAVVAGIYVDAGVNCAHTFYRDTFCYPRSIQMIGPKFSPFRSQGKKKLAGSSLQLYAPRPHASNELLRALTKDVSPTLPASYQELDKADKTIRIEFTDKRLLLYVFLHKSVLPEAKSMGSGTIIKQQDKLAHLGNAVNMLAMTEYLLYLDGDQPMFTLNEKRMKLNSRENLSRIAHDMGLDKHAIIGDCMRHKGLADSARGQTEMFNRLVGAIYLEKGLRKACQYVVRLL